VLLGYISQVIAEGFERVLLVRGPGLCSGVGVYQEKLQQG
jgi:hypothetical protein